MHLTKVEHLEDIKNKFSPNSKTANEGVKKWAEDYQTCHQAHMATLFVSREIKVKSIL